jgi:hypothetical protein
MKRTLNLCNPPRDEIVENVTARAIKVAIMTHDLGELFDFTRFYECPVTSYETGSVQ